MIKIVYLINKLVNQVKNWLTQDRANQLYQVMRSAPILYYGMGNIIAPYDLNWHTYEENLTN